MIASVARQLGLACFLLIACVISPGSAIATCGEECDQQYASDVDDCHSQYGDDPKDADDLAACAQDARDDYGSCVNDCAGSGRPDSSCVVRRKSAMSGCIARLLCQQEVTRPATCVECREPAFERLNQQREIAYHERVACAAVICPEPR
jgi:hypothetical protein